MDKEVFPQRILMLIIKSQDQPTNLHHTQGSCPSRCSPLLPFLIFATFSNPYTHSVETLSPPATRTSVIINTFWQILKSVSVSDLFLKLQIFAFPRIYYKFLYLKGSNSNTSHSKLNSFLIPLLQSLEYFLEWP